MQGIMCPQPTCLTLNCLHDTIYNLYLHLPSCQFISHHFVNNSRISSLIKTSQPSHLARVTSHTHTLQPNNRTNLLIHMIMLHPWYDLQESCLHLPAKSANGDGFIKSVSLRDVVMLMVWPLLTLTSCSPADYANVRVDMIHGTTWDSVSCDNGSPCVPTINTDHHHSHQSLNSVKSSVESNRAERRRFSMRILAFKL